jgi:peptidoglycan/xylan/chitin deacetylase (PgdA/CDA1 family)
MHGVADGVRQDQFKYRNLLEAEQFCAFLRSAPKFVPLADALQGRGRALTIDDATVASARAAKLARNFGHAVTLFVNPWHVEVGQPYWFSRINALLDSIKAPKLSLDLDGRRFDLTTFDGKSELRTYIKTLMRRHITPAQNVALIDTVEEQLGVSGIEISRHDHCLKIEDVLDLHGSGVDIQNHGWTHLDPLASNLMQFTDHFYKARLWLKDRLAIETRFYASPFGEFFPDLDFLRRNEAACLLLHNDLPPGSVEDRIVNRITLEI